MNKTIKELAVQLTIEITAVCDNIKGRTVFVNQLLRSCSSIGANSYEAKYAQSTADFVNKLEIALKECYETDYWLEILFKVGSMDENTYKTLANKCGAIRRKLIASITTAKKTLKTNNDFEQNSKLSFTAVIVNISKGGQFEMTYRIIKNRSGGTYISPIFALKYVGWKSEVIVFDETFEKIAKMKMWDSGFAGIHRKVFVIENDFDTSGGDWAGYDWVINDKALFKALRSKKGAGIETFPLFKDYCKEISIPDIFEIKNEKDIAALEDVAFGFHDSLIREYTENKNNIVIRFDTTWDCYITVTFEEVTEADFKEKVGQILDSEIKKTDEGFSFTVIDGFAGWIDGCDYSAEMGEPYIKCKKIFWRIEIA